MGVTVQGQGRTTLAKEHCIQGALTVSLRIASKANLMRWPFWYADLHCGSGFNEEAQCMGSPIAFRHAVAAASNRPFRAFFVDRSLERVRALEQLLARDHAEFSRSCFTFAGENGGLLPTVAEWIAAEEKPEHAVGAVLCDPNGWFRDIPVPELVAFTRRFPKIDLILNLSVRTYQLERPHIERGNGKWAGRVHPAPSDIPTLLSRRHWLIHEPMSAGGHRFMMMVGRNLDVGDWKALGFHHLHSARGRAIVEEIERGRNTRPGAAVIPALPDIPGLLGAPAVPGGPRGGNAQGEMDV